MRLVTLGSSQPLTKHFSLQNRNLLVTPYPHALNFTSEEHSIETIEQLFELIQTAGAAGKCLLKGLLTMPLLNEPRAGKHLLEEPTQWLVLDFDDLHAVDDVDEVLTLLQLHRYDHVLQYSASMGLNPKKGLSAHVFFLLDHPVSPNSLKQWLTHLNLSVPLLTDQLRLTRSGMSLHWPLDITVAQNDKLIYIAPPSYDASVTDTLTEPRLQLRKRTLTHVDCVPLAAPDTSERKAEKINELRSQQGLPPRTFATREFFSTQVLKSADPAKTFEIAQVARGYVYLNLNGGDSRAYYHPCDNPEVIYNFKGEPNYATKELLPEYYEQAKLTAKVYRREQRERLALERREQREQIKREAQAQARQNRAEQADQKMQQTIEEFDELPDPNHPNAQGVRFFIVEDRQTGKYWKGSYDYTAKTLDITPSRTRQSLIDFALANTGIRPAYIPQWDVYSDFHTFANFDPVHKFINLWKPSPYLVEAYKNPLTPPPPTTQAQPPPPTISKVINSICNHDPLVYEHFLNWLAYLWQYRDKSKTAWIFHGTTGTGKGILFHRILRPLFGEQLAQIRTLDMLEEPFNGYMSDTLLLFIDESDTDKVKNIHKIVAKLKSWITEPTIAIREMYMGQYQATSHLNIIFASNKHNPMQIDRNDRRFNVAPRQETRLLLSDEEYDLIADELQAFAHYLTAHKVDLAAARTAMDTTAKHHVQEATTDAPQDVADAILAGDLRFFIDLLPQQHDATFESEVIDPVRSAYRKLLNYIADKERTTCGEFALARDDIQLLFRYTVGWESSTPHKFTKAISRYGLKLKVNSIDGAAVRSIRTTWKVTPEDRELLELLSQPQPQLRRVK